MLKKICQCIGIASLILVGNYGDLLGGGSDVRMHTPRPLTRVCAAQIADIFIVAAFLFIILAIASRSRFYPWVRLVFAIVLPPYLIQRTQSFFPFDLIEGLVLILLVAWTGILLLLLLRFGKWYRRLMRVGSAIAAALIVFAVCSIAQLLWVAHWKPAPNQIVANWEVTPQPPRQHPLLVWIIFDELSYDQVFEHRARDLNLPNFDALRSESTVFTDTQPAGYHTVKIIPSLLTGKIVDGIHYNFHNRLWVHHENESGWVPIDGSQTVFADAEKSGWRTAAVGWYNPYCAIYSDAIQNCFWTNHDMFDGLMSQRASLGRKYRHAAAAGGPRTEIALTRRPRSLHLRRTPPLPDAHRPAGPRLSIAAHDQADFVFLHFAIPHSPNIWSRIHDDYTQFCDSSYLDNLALTDRVLGQVVAILKSSPRWNQTSLIVEGDHGWRIDAWDWLPAWTEEDDAASRGVFDQRPALLIHQPGQSQTQVVAQPWPLIQVHGVVEQILHGQPATF